MGLSQSEGTQEMAVSVDRALFRVPSHLGVADPRSTLRQVVGGTVEILVRTATLATFRDDGFSARMGSNSEVGL